MSEKIFITYNTVTGAVGDCEFDSAELMESILPDMRPPISYISFEGTDSEGKKYTVSISKSGVFISDGS